MKTLAGILTLVSVVALVVIYRAGVSSLSFFESAKGAPWGRITLLVVGMLFGIMFGHLHAAVSETKGQVKIWEVVRLGLADGAFWASLFASPVLFGVVYVAASSQPDIVLAAVFSFENGFFCQRILERRTRELVQ